MFDINLLPWRSQKRQQEIYTQRLSVLLGIIMGAVFWVLVHEGLNFYGGKITTKSQVLKDKLIQMESQVVEIKKWKHQNESWVRHEKYIREMRIQQRIFIKKFTHVLSVTELPIKFSEIIFTKASINLLGQISSIDLLSLLTKTLNKTSDFNEIKIRNVRQESRSGMYNFEVTAQ